MFKVNEGDNFTRWAVLDIFRSKTSHKMCRVECTCGTIKEIRESTLLSGESKSCGCLAKELASERNKTHGLSNHVLYDVWHSMVQRCTKPKRKDYNHYGGRGIKVCGRWLELENFIADMYSTYEEGLELDRVDVDGNYELGNCRWATRREQVINRRPMNNGFDANIVEYNGRELCLSQWAEVLKIPPSVLSDRLGKLNWTIAEAFSTPLRTSGLLIKFAGEEFTVKDIYKSPPNIYPYIQKLGLKLEDFMYHSLIRLGEDLEVSCCYGKCWSKYEPSDLSLSLKQFRYTQKFDEILKKLGIDYE